MFITEPLWFCYTFEEATRRRKRDILTWILKGAMHRAMTLRSPFELVISAAWAARVCTSVVRSSDTVPRHFRCLIKVLRFSMRSNWSICSAPDGAWSLLLPMFVRLSGLSGTSLSHWQKSLVMTQKSWRNIILLYQSHQPQVECWTRPILTVERTP